MKRHFALLVAAALAINFFCMTSSNLKAAEGDSITLKSTIRDFDPVNDDRPELSHSDFENSAYFSKSAKGAVKSTLGKDNTPVYSSSGYSVKIITSEESFYDWYHDTSKNMNINYNMVFNKSGKNYVFDSTLTKGFFPINNQGFGNYYQDKNYHFTLELHTKFTYKTGQKFSIAGDDDVWLFINKKLVGDLGGIHETQTVNIDLDDYADSLGMVSGEAYGLDLFFAERHITESNLKITTNIALANNVAPTANAGDNQTRETDRTSVNVGLDGSKSTDSNGDKLTYTWKNEAGDTIAKGVTPKVDLAVGKHKLTLTVSDGDLTDTDSVVIEVTKKQPTPTVKPTSTPTAKLTSTPTVKPTSTPTLKPTSTPTVKPTSTPTLKPTSTPTVKPTLKPSSTPTLKPTLKPTSTPTVKLTPTIKPTVKKTEKPSDRPAVISSGGNRNDRPVANAGADQIILTGEETALVKLDGSKSSDPDNDSLTYKWINESNVIIANSATPSIKLPLGDSKITLTVSDGKISSTDTVNIKVQKQEVPSSGGISPDIAILLTADGKKVEEGKEFTFTVKYVNKTDIKAEDVYVELNLPDVQVVDKAEGVQTGNKISWKVGELEPGEKGEITFIVKSDLLEKAEIIKDFVATILSRKSVLENTYDDSSKLGIMVYSNRFEHSHTRYILGYPDNTFKGERSITRAETAVIFARIMNLKDLELTITKQFVDVEPGFWAENHIYAAVQVGLFKGVDSVHFNPNTPIKRAELATVIANYLGISRTSEQKPFESTFSDITNHWAQGNIEEVARYKIAQGYDDGAFRPQKNITRQEAVAMINRLLFRGPLTNVTNSFPDLIGEHWAFGDVEEAVRSHSLVMDEDGTEVMSKHIDEPIW